MSEGADKLAHSRLAIIEHIQHKKEGKPAARERTKAQTAHAQETGYSDEAPKRQGRFGSIAEAGRDYWQHHPARLAVELAMPALSSYARQRPLRFLGYAAAAGALLVFARPWKLISVTGLVVAALRSPQLSSLVAQAVSAGRFGEDGQEPE